jgi:hypothetical protein
MTLMRRRSSSRAATTARRGSRTSCAARRVIRAPPFVAPHQPRLDFQLWFLPLGGRLRALLRHAPDSIPHEARDGGEPLRARSIPPRRRRSSSAWRSIATASPTARRARRAATGGRARRSGRRSRSRAAVRELSQLHGAGTSASRTIRCDTRRTRLAKIYDFVGAPNPKRLRVYLAEKGIKVPTSRSTSSRATIASPSS